MYLNVINPVGIASSVDLAGLPLWRIELDRWPAPGADPSRRAVLGLVLRYVIGAATVEGAGRTVTQVVQLAGIDTGTNGDELVDAVTKGFPHVDRDDNRRAMKDALGIVYNAVDKAAEADGMIERALALVDLRHGLLEALWQTRPEVLGALGPRWSASYEGYRCALVTGRFDPWLIAPVAPSALIAEPGAPPPIGGRKGKGKGAPEGPPASALT